MAARSSLRSYYRWAVESGLRTDDPSARTKAVKVPPRTIKEAPQGALLEALERVGERDRLAILLAAVLSPQPLHRKVRGLATAGAGAPGPILSVQA